MLEESRRAGRPADDAVRQAVNAAAREVLKEYAPTAPAARKPFVVRPVNMGKPLIDIECTARALDLLDQLDRKP